MIYGVYASKDELRGFTALFLGEGDEVVARDFNSGAGNVPFFKDYSLWRVGDFDTSADNPITTFDAPVLVCRGYDAKGDNNNESGQ